MPPKLETYTYRNDGVTDGATAEDTLGFEPYVRAMATFLTNPHTKGPLTISIEGEWGSGKSSFMLQLKSRLEGNKHKGIKSAAEVWTEDEKLEQPLKPPIVIEFNAWRHDKAEELWAAFALEILRVLSQELGIWKRWWIHLRLLKLRFDWAQGWWDVVCLAAPLIILCAFALGLPVIVGVDKVMAGLTEGTPASAIWQGVLALGDRMGYSIVYVAVVVFLFVWLKNFVGNPFSADLSKHVSSPDYNARAGFIERFHQDFSKILDAYVPHNRKVVCFIDDLDRCEVPKAADLMQAINLMLPTDERMIFLLGMDRLKIAAGLAVKFKDLIPLLPEPGVQAAAKSASEERASAPSGRLWFGHDFIEKFVQIAYSLPRPAPQNLDRFLKHLTGSSSPAREEKTSWRGRATGWLRNRFRKAHGGVRGLYRKVSGWFRPASAGEEGGQIRPKEPAPQPAIDPELGAQQKRKQLVRSIELRAGQKDPSILEELVRVIAPAFDYNPRRLKQFVNLYRLNLATAAETEMLHVEEGSEETGIRLEPLGKFVALGIRWPDVVHWLAPFHLSEAPKTSSKISAKELTVTETCSSRFDSAAPIGCETCYEPGASGLTARWTKAGRRYGVWTALMCSVSWRSARWQSRSRRGAGNPTPTCCPNNAPSRTRKRMSVRRRSPPPKKPFTPTGPWPRTTPPISPTSLRH